MTDNRPAEQTAAEWVIHPDTRICATSESLMGEAAHLSYTLAACGLVDRPPVVTCDDPEEAGSHDILLGTYSEAALRPQGFAVIVQDRLTVLAVGNDGVFNGCRYVAQHLIHRRGLTVGQTYSFAPSVAERALLLDCGRKYYTPAWIKRLIREMSWAGLNALVLHFSEEMGLGLESATYPWLAGRDGTLCVARDVDTDNRVLTRANLRDIARVAKQYHVELIPSFDSPGHMNYIVKTYNEHFGVEGLDGIGNYFHKDGAVSIVQGSRNTAHSRGIDISNPTAVAFARELITEYATFFRDELGCTKFDMGGDELLGWGGVPNNNHTKWQQLDHWAEYARTRSGDDRAVAYDGFLLFMNDLYDLLSGLGYRSVRMWNDDAYRRRDTGWQGAVNLNPNIEIEYWSGTENPVSAYLGHRVYNYVNTYNYYVLKENLVYEGANPASMYAEWSPFTYGEDTLRGTDADRVGGSAFCVWCDDPSYEDEDTVLEHIRPMLHAHAAKSWYPNLPEKIPFADYEAFVTRIGNAPNAHAEA